MKKNWLFAIVILTLFTGGCLPQTSATPTPAPSPLPTWPPTPLIPTDTPVPAATSTQLPELTLEKGPYLILTADPGEMKICWQPVAPSAAVLEWGTDQNYSAGSIQIAAAGLEDLTTATLTGLQPSTRYYYRITIEGAAVTGNFVSLEANEGQNLTFWVYGDSGSGQETHNALDAAILQSIASDPSSQTLLFSTGDLMESASEENLQENEFSPDSPASRKILSEMPIVNTMGNHDGTRLFLKYFPYPYTGSFDWSFDDGPVHFVIIDQYYGGDETAPRWQWLRNDLATTTKKWKVLLLHEPGWSAGPHPNNLDVQKIIHPIAVRYGVALVLAGHNHYYARAEVDGVTYITTGGAGSLLYDPEYGFPYIVMKDKEHHFLKIQVNGNQLTLRAMTAEGKIIDQIEISK